MMCAYLWLATKSSYKLAVMLFMYLLPAYHYDIKRNLAYPDIKPFVHSDLVICMCSPMLNICTETNCDKECESEFNWVICMLESQSSQNLTLTGL